MTGDAGLRAYSEAFKVVQNPQGHVPGQVSGDTVREFTPAPYYIVKGRYYVDGILCENEETVPATQQPNLPPDSTQQNNPLPSSPGIYIVYLDVWEEYVACIEDSSIREAALLGPDTTVRRKTVWQVKLLNVGRRTPPTPGGAGTFTGIGFDDYLKDWQAFVASTVPTGRLRARTNGIPNDIPAEAGYMGLDYQLYRVEIHDAGSVPANQPASGSASLPTFKWSRNNYTIKASITVLDVKGSSAVGTINGVGLVPVDSAPYSPVQPNGVGLFFIPPVGASVWLEFDSDEQESHPTWDSGLVPCSLDSRDNDGYIELEEGVEVKFEKGTYRTGDYWQIPARGGSVQWPKESEQVNWANIATAGSGDARRLMDFLVQTHGLNWTMGNQFVSTGVNLGGLRQIDIQGVDSSGGKHAVSLAMSANSQTVAIAIDGSKIGTIPVKATKSGTLMLQCDVPAPLSPHGIVHHYAPLAIVVYDDAGNVLPIADCRDGSTLIAAMAYQWKYLPVRRTAEFLEESLSRGTQWAVFEPNAEPLWSSIRLNVGSFMQVLFNQGAFEGSTPQQAYFVKCDTGTTTQIDIDNGIVNILVGFAPLMPAEFVIIKIQQMAGQADG